MARIIAFRPRLGDIGKEQREYEFEPLTSPAPAEEPTPVVVPEAEPEKVPA